MRLGLLIRFEGNTLTQGITALLGVYKMGLFDALTLESLEEVLVFLFIKDFSLMILSMLYWS